MTPLGAPVQARILTVTSAMKHFLTFLFAILLFGAGGVILVANMKALTIPILIGIGACFLLAMLLAIPADLQKALVIIVPYLPDAIVGGRRRTDPASTTPPAGPPT